MDGASDQRQHERREYVGQVRGESAYSVFYGTIQDLSVGGMCFEVDDLMHTGQELTLTFTIFSPESIQLSIPARVVWVEPVHMLFHRVGVRFTVLSPSAESALLDGDWKVCTATSNEVLSGRERYPELFRPFSISHLTLKNRLTMAPMFWGYANEDGTVSQTLLERFCSVSNGGVGMVVVANTIVDERGIMAARVLRVDDDCFIPGLTRLAAAIKASGAVAGLQLNHAGRWAIDAAPLSPSPMSMDISPELDTLGGMRKELSRRHQMRMVNKFLSAMMKCRKEMTQDDIDAVKEAYGQAALRAKSAGFDLVELHGATGYLLVQFLSPRSNRRTDRYGGTLENRMRFPLEVVDAVKSYVGSDYPVGYRFLADEWIDGGVGIDEAVIFAGELEKAGVAYLSATAGTYESFFLPEIMNKCREEGYLRPLSRRLKAAVSKVPVIIAGRIIRPDLAETILKEGEGDLIGLARTLFCDPSWPNKVYAGKLDDIIPCKGCRTCLMRAVNNEPVICSRWDKLEQMDLGVGLKSKQAKWENVLILMDDSQRSMEAVSYAGNMIGSGKRVTLFSLVKNDERAEAVREERRKLLAHAAELLQSAGIRERDLSIKVAVTRKGVEEDILEEIRTGKYGSVILGRRGISKTRQFFFGSISNYVVHHAKDCSIWVVD